MTAQIRDVCRYRDVDHAVVDASDGWLFDPCELGLDPVGSCTACHRGYVATFAVRDGRLVVDDLDVNLYGPEGRRVVGPAVHGVRPTGGRSGLFDHRYRRLGHRLHYTGGLLVAAEIVRERNAHTRDYRPWEYRTAFELTFDAGRLVGEADRSAEVAAVRARATADPPGRDVGRSHPAYSGDRNASV